MDRAMLLPENAMFRMISRGQSNTQTVPERLSQCIFKHRTSTTYTCDERLHDSPRYFTLPRNGIVLKETHISSKKRKTDTDRLCIYIFLFDMAFS